MRDEKPTKLIEGLAQQWQTRQKLTTELLKVNQKPSRCGVISVISLTARPNSQPQSAHSQTAVNRLPRKSLITSNQIYIFITDNTITHPKRQLCELWKYGRTETSFIRHNCNCSWFRLLDIVVGDFVSADLGLFWESFWWMGIRTGLFRSMEGVQEIELWPGDLRQWVSFPRFR